jgi:hypothetical protein
MPVSGSLVWLMTPSATLKPFEAPAMNGVHPSPVFVFEKCKWWHTGEAEICQTELVEEYLLILKATTVQRLAACDV